jgi:AcrR family transcriptional regulator
MAPADKQEAILDAALELFVERGFHGTAVPLVAERAGVGAGTIYRYFDSKEALVNALYRRWKGVMAQIAFADFPVGEPERVQFHALWQRLSRFVLSHPRAFAFLELHHHASYLDAESRAVEDQLLGFVTEFVRRAQARQAVREAAPLFLMALVWGAFVGVVRAGWEGKIELTEETLAAAETYSWEMIRK